MVLDAFPTVPLNVRCYSEGTKLIRITLERPGRRTEEKAREGKRDFCRAKGKEKI